MQHRLFPPATINPPRTRELRLKLPLYSADLPLIRTSYLVCYDIANPKRLRHVFKFLRDFGDHLQFSIFECQLTPSDLAQCRGGLSQLIHHLEDQVLFVNLGPAAGRGDRVITALGKPYTNIDAPCIVV